VQRGSTGVVGEADGNVLIAASLTRSPRDAGAVSDCDHSRELRRSTNLRQHGWVAEWFKAHAWKVCVRQKRTVGSNPTPSVDAATSYRRCGVVLSGVRNGILCPFCAPQGG
jgi:hypothetical protein